MTPRDKSIDRVLTSAQRRFGLGNVRGPGWVHDRVGAFLDAYVERAGITWEQVAVRLMDDTPAMNELMASLRVGETRFLRDPPQWNAIVDHLLAKVRPGVPIQALSAGCSTGEEAYTLAILLAERGRRFQITGIDRSPEAIEAARRGRYAYEQARELPRSLRLRHFEDDGAAVTVRAPLRMHVTFEVRDLLLWLPRGRFHVILFKNVLLYLAERTGTRVATRLASALEEGGILVPAASEVVRLSAALEPLRLSPGVIAFQPRPSLIP
ncbi:MAG: CheR family methyltransferase [Polyangiaceae bacterium]